ncbi:MAG: transposase [Pseudomonadota bacterium]
MSKQPRRRFTPEFKELAVARLSAPGGTQSSVAKELGVTLTQLKTWRLELEAAGSVEAVRRQQAEATELSDLRRENRRLKEELEVMREGGPV